MGLTTPRLQLAGKARHKREREREGERERERERHFGQSPKTDRRHCIGPTDVR